MAGEPLLNRRISGIVVTTENDQGADIYLSIARKLAAAINRSYVHVQAKTGVPWLTDLSTDLSSLQSRSLIVFGGLLESAITQVTLTALLDGYDVFLATDLTETDEPDHRPTFLSRIQSCGATIITARQAVRELITMNGPDADRTDLAKLLDELTVRRD